MLIAVAVALSVFAVLAHIAPFRFVLDAAYGDAAVWRMPVTGTEKPIYMTFDDGPNPTATPELLDMLKAKGARATFFLIDDYITKETAPIVRRMFEDGHCVGQHTGRRWLLLRSPSHVAEMLHAGASKIERLTGHRPCSLFRPHAGWRSVALFEGAERAGYTIVGWSWRTWDSMVFRKRTGPRVSAQLVANAGPGKILVMHDGHHRNPRADRQYAIEAAERTIDQLRASGYTLKTLCALRACVTSEHPEVISR